MYLKIVLVLLTFSLVIQGCSPTRSITPSTTSSSYDPLAVGNYRIYQEYDSPRRLTVEVVEEDVLINGKKYFKILRTYSTGKETTDYSRIENEVHFSYDDKTGAESMWLRNEMKVGKKWQQADKSWEYEVMNIDATVTTPVDTYHHLLHIRARQLTLPGNYKRDGEKCLYYDLFFLRGIGQITSKCHDEWLFYLIEAKAL